MVSDTLPVSRKRIALGVALIVPVLGVLALLGYGFTVEQRDIRSPLIGRPAAPFTLPLFDGGTLSLDELRGKAVFVNFWASWCPPCREEARLLEAAWQQYKGQGVVFVGINVQDEESRAREFLREFGISYPNGIDRGGRISVEYGIWGLPEAFFIDRQGRITYKHVGALGPQTIADKLQEALRGVVSVSEGRGNFQSTR